MGKLWRIRWNGFWPLSGGLANYFPSLFSTLSLNLTLTLSLSLTLTLIADSMIVRWIVIHVSKTRKIASALTYPVCAINASENAPGKYLDHALWPFHSQNPGAATVWDRSPRVGTELTRDPSQPEGHVTWWPDWLNAWRFDRTGSGLARWPLTSPDWPGHNRWPGSAVCRNHGYVLNDTIKY